MGSAEEDASRLAHASLAAGDPTGWFDRLYREARDGSAIVPWDRGAPNAMLVEWAAGQSGDGRSAIVVGSGPGRDAEFVASLGFVTTAFDVSPTAIDEARRRHPESTVRYEVADLLDLPEQWRGAFEFVLESHNVQALPPALHAEASAAVASLVAPGGMLLVFAAAGDGTYDGPPWPLTRGEIEAFASKGLVLDHADAVPVDVTRWRAEFHRPADD